MKPEALFSDIQVNDTRRIKTGLKLSECLTLLDMIHQNTRVNSFPGGEFGRSHFWSWVPGKYSEE